MTLENEALERQVEWGTPETDLEGQRAAWGTASRTRGKRCQSCVSSRRRFLPRCPSLLPSLVSPFCWMGNSASLEKERPLRYKSSFLWCSIILLYFYFYFFKINLFIYLFLAMLGLRCCAWLSLVEVSGGYSSFRCTGFSLLWLLLLRSMGSRCAGFSNCGVQAQ